MRLTSTRVCWLVTTIAIARVVASIQFWDDVSTYTERAWANARLLAKAPEMFQALKELLHFAANGMLTNPPVEFYAIEYKANLLIAEVEGDE